MGFIEDFYNGNIEPQKRNLKQYSVYTTDFNRLREHGRHPQRKAQENERSLFVEYINLLGIISGDIDFAGYRKGFRHGASFSLDVFCTENWIKQL